MAAIIPLHKLRMELGRVRFWMGRHELYLHTANLTSLSFATAIAE